MPALPPASPSGQDGRADKGVVFVHSVLDDYGLTPPQFRIYGHLSRRAGSGVAFPAVASMARICKLHPQTVRKALRFLVKNGFITREHRPGTTPYYRLTPHWRWTPQPNDGGNPAVCATTLSHSVAPHAKAGQGHPCETDGAEGTPLEDDPKKKNIHSGRAIEIPRSEVEAIEQAGQVGIPQEFARNEYLRLESIGWRNGSGNSIRKWVPHVRKRWADDQNQHPRRNPQAGIRPNRPSVFVPKRTFSSADYQQPVEKF